MNSQADNLAVTSNLRASGRLLGAIHVARVAARRMAWSRQTVVSIVVLLFSLLVVFAWSLHGDRSSKNFMMHIVLPIYLTFLLPIFSLSYATAVIAGEREDQTLIYLLCTPLPRPLVYLAKFAATLTVVASWTLGGLLAITAVAGEPAWPVFYRLWPIAAISTVAYVGLFQLISVVLRRATIVGLCYALFLETFLGNMPGIAKRVAISFYTKCLFFEVGKDFGIDLTRRRHAEQFFSPVSAETAWIALAVVSALLILAGAVWFSHREYND